MRGYMTMKQAFECGNDDFPFIEGSFNVNQTCQKTKREILDNWPTLSYDSALSDQWQVKTAEPRVLTADDMHTIMICGPLNRAPNNNEVIEYGEAMHQNGRLERDTELRPFFKEFENYYLPYRGTHKVLCNIFDNLKPLNPGG